MDPVAFVSRNPQLKVPTKQLWNTIASKLAAGASGIEKTAFDNSTIGKTQDYIYCKGDIQKMYSEVESRLVNIDQATFAMEAPNWRSGSSLPEEDFSEEVKQFNDSLNQILSIKGLQMPLAGLWQCQMYAGTVELSGKKIKVAAKYHTRNLTDIPKLGVAIDLLKSKGYADSMKHFDSHLRNGIAHGNYIVQPSKIDYVDYPTSSSGLPIHGSETVSGLVSKNVGVILFLWAALVVNAERYIALINTAIAKFP